ncbi:unnamed protein product [Darwinula stevensoni]|uniref:Peptidase S1 domain-containing protein n=1 Tax=Darwinula stevensoni TaxID=69355 RepID=A0A7R8X351_9CRUS|nr:unnamed protein product [Darwinula stevensoni]CAG0881970.1 unnamed protein product [Darwinula stevensoni]
MVMTTTPCGTSSLARDEAAYIGELRQVQRSWLERFWNRFTGILFWTQREEDPLIVGGSPAAITEAPFMAFVSSSFPKQGMKKLNVGCSASIISEQWILTAAQCLYDERGNFATKVTVHVGSADSTSGTADQPSGTDAKADRWIPHPNYSRDDNTRNYDVALIHLRKSLKLDSTMQPICYPQSDDVLGTSISLCDQKAYGWGYLQTTDQSISTILQKLSVQVTPVTSECTTYTDGRIICVKGVPPSSGICFGDGGGPLVVRYNSRAYVTGIASFVQNNTCAAAPAGYTRASTYASWVKSTIGA